MRPLARSWPAPAATRRSDSRCSFSATASSRATWRRTRSCGCSRRCAASIRSVRSQPWLFSIVRNRVIDLRRRAHSRGERGSAPSRQGAEGDAGERPLDPPDAEPGPLERSERGELQRLMWSCLGRLDRAHREILVLRDYQDLSYREIAEVLGGSARHRDVAPACRAPASCARRCSRPDIDSEVGHDRTVASARLEREHGDPVSRGAPVRLPRRRADAAGGAAGAAPSRTIARGQGDARGARCAARAGAQHSVRAGRGSPVERGAAHARLRDRDAAGYRAARAVRSRSACSACRGRRRTRRPGPR